MPPLQLPERLTTVHSDCGNLYLISAKARIVSRCQSTLQYSIQVQQERCVKPSAYTGEIWFSSGLSQSYLRILLNRSAFSPSAFSWHRYACAAQEHRFRRPDISMTFIFLEWKMREEDFEVVPGVVEILTWALYFFLLLLLLYWFYVRWKIIWMKLDTSGVSENSLPVVSVDWKLDGGFVSVC